MLGSRLKLDCYGCAREKLVDLDLLSAFLDAFPGKLGLTKVMPPSVFRYEEGLSGVVMFAEAHLAVHTFPDRQEAALNIFSRRSFNAELALKELLGFFAAADHEVEIINAEPQGDQALNVLQQIS